MSQPQILKPWYNASANDGSSCFDVQFLADGTVQTRNSKRTGTQIDYTADEWTAFITGAKEGKFDHPGV
jgi:hypothetical protein